LLRGDAFHFGSFGSAEAMGQRRRRRDLKKNVQRE
jgi:hypothetical protein